MQTKIAKAFSQMRKHRKNVIGNLKKILTHSFENMFDAFIHFLKGLNTGHWNTACQILQTVGWKIMTENLEIMSPL